MFTNEEAFSFTETKLKVNNVKERMSRPAERRKLLDEIIRKFNQFVPFQNLRLLCETPENRHRPSIEEIKTDLTKGIGGLCYNINVAAFFLLKAIGFKVTLVHADVSSSVVFPNNHVLVFVSDLQQKGDKFLVDVALGSPAHRAVSLDFETESPEFMDSYLEYKYVKRDGEILRMHRKGCPLRARNTRNAPVDFYIGEWRRFCTVHPKETEKLEDFDADFDRVFQTREPSSFHNTIRVVGFKDGKSVMVIDQKTVIENDQGMLEQRPIEGGDQEVIATILYLFPAMQEQMVKDAVANYRAYP